MENNKKSDWLMIVIKKEDKEYFNNFLIKEGIFKEGYTWRTIDLGEYHINCFSGDSLLINKICNTLHQMKLVPFPLCIDKWGDF